MDSVTITINGLIASGRAGMTIWELAREMGIFIPTLCYDPELSPAGACRICLVEEERTGALLASCVTPLSPGMVIQTDSPRVRENRKMIVKLMLASHPESCLLCEKGNRCQLRKIAADLNIGLLDLYKLPNYMGTQEVNPFLSRDLSKCILCGKCIRADHELVVEGAIDYFQRGFAAKPATLHDQPLEKSNCTFCGTCASLCPTGALSEKGKPSLSSSLKSFSSICPYCACGCGLSLRTNGLEVVEVEPERGKKTTNQVTLCGRGHYGWDFIRSRERLTSPLMKRGDHWQECSWPEAFDFAAQKLKNIWAGYGPEALAFFGSSKCTNEENYLFQKLARWGIGTNNIDNGSRVYGLPDPGVFGPEWAWGAMTRPIADLEEAKCILVVGANPAETAPLVAYKIKRAVRFKKSQLILIDPRWTRLAPFAQPWLRPKLGQDGLLICGFLRVILEEEFFEHKQWESYFGWAEFKEEVNSYSLPEIAKITGINEQIIQDCARQLALQKPMAIVFGNGLWPKGEEYFNLGA
ncbi:MAG: molybdopterin-dependent oxidoreductase, partial [Thermodesulfobacteriota bacterium]